MARTRGRVLEQSHRPVPQVDEPSSNVCVYPTEAELEVLVAYLSSRHLTVVSIGCGEGFLEGLLEQRGVEVLSVDLEPSPAALASVQRQRCFCREIVRVPASALFDIPAPSSSALLFCFPRRCPLDAYLQAFPACRHVVMIGDDGGVTSPVAHALSGRPGWTLVQEMEVRGVMRPIWCVMYERAPEA